MRVQDLLEMTGQSVTQSEIQNNIINVYYDLEHFDLQLMQVKGGIYTLNGLTNYVTLGELEKQIKNFEHNKKNLYQTADLIIRLPTGREIYAGDKTFQNETLRDLGINRFSQLKFYYKYITVYFFDVKEPKYISLKGQDKMTQPEFKEALRAAFPELPEKFSLLCEGELVTQHKMVYNNSKVKIVDLVAIGEITVNTYIKMDMGPQRCENMSWENKMFKILD